MYLRFRWFPRAPSQTGQALFKASGFPSKAVFADTSLVCGPINRRAIEGRSYSSVLTVSPYFLGLPSFPLYAPFARSEYYDGSALTRSAHCPYQSALRQLWVRSPVAP